MRCPPCPSPKLTHCAANVARTAWQNFKQFSLYNLTRQHPTEFWTIGNEDGGIYNLSNPDMRAAWVQSLVFAWNSGVIDGFFIDITPQVSGPSTMSSNIVYVYDSILCNIISRLIAQVCKSIRTYIMTIVFMFRCSLTLWV